MIDFLSSANWINPQIDFLVGLQNIRLQQPEIFNKLFLSVTTIGEIWFPTLICAIYYWCINSKKGLYLFALVGFHFIFGQLAKMLACVYRPWILSDKIQPVPEAVAYARGYSFPSGHSSMAASLLGGLAFIFRRKLLLCLFLVLTILMVGFSRLWLGVHTPQDVCAGLLSGFVLVFAVNLIIEWAEQFPKKRYPLLLGVINVFALAALIYICYFNHYRIDYVDGKILVNPFKAIHTTIVCYGFSLGIINGGFLCRAYFPFEPAECGVKERLIRAIVGAVYILLMLLYPLEFCFSPACSSKAAFIFPLIMGFSLTAVYPLIFTKINSIINKK